MGLVEIQEKVGWWSWGAVGINNAFAPTKKEPKSLQHATCIPLAQNILQMLSRGFAPDHAGEAYSAPPDPLAEFAAGSHDRELSRVETRHTHITAAEYSLPTGQPVAWFAIGD